MGARPTIEIGDTVIFKNIDNWSYSRIWYSRYDRNKYSQTKQVVRWIDGRDFKIIGTNMWFDKQWVESVEKSSDLIIKN